MIPSNKRRKIIVDDQIYYWTTTSHRVVFKKDNNIKTMEVYIQCPDGQPLKVKVKGLYECKDRLNNNYETIWSPSLLPSDVRTLILEAKKSGWDPNNKNTKRFVLNKNIKLTEYWVETDNG
jgi:hypothetical protein